MAKDLLMFRVHPLLGCGPVRMGNEPVGGLTWLDFNHEFEDTLPVKQICGHTGGKTVRRKGRSYCIDGHQSSYALIARDGTATFKSLVKTAVSGTWVEEAVIVEDLT